MRLIDSKDFQQWSEKYTSKGYFPILISRLVKAITPVNATSEFPSGTAVFVGGWDGIVDSPEDVGYVPQGTSLWEFGTEKGVNQKANEDYLKRSTDPLGYDPKQSTFIFATPRIWRDRDKWQKEKLKEGIWKDIKVYDSRNLEEWIDETPAVARWFAAEIGKYPYDGIVTIEEFWKEWAYGPLGILPYSLLTSGREKECESLLDFLSSPANIKGVKAESKDEAVAFIIAAALQFIEIARSRFLSKSLIIEKDSHFRSIRINRRYLNLIAKFDQVQILFAAVGDGHHVLVPLGPDDVFHHDTITLSKLSREGQISSLVTLGYTEELAKRLSIEAARNITVLKRLIKYPQSQAPWLETWNISELIPALLLGRWDEARSGDISLIETLSGEDYQSYSSKLNRWLDAPESPVIKIGSTWRLTSPLDCWTAISGILKPKDFENLRTCTISCLKEGNLLAEEQSNEFFSTTQRPYSRWAREGTIQSLILISLYGKGLNMAIDGSAEEWVDELIEELLYDASGELWKSLDHEMPLLAEASPTSFLSAVNTSLGSKDQTIKSLFTVKGGFVMASSYHTGLLWALEGLAWMPEHFMEAVLTLGRLCALEADIQIHNKPINSLSEIFKSWHFQTLASLEDRMSALDKLSEIDFNTSWTLLIRLLPSDHGMAQPTHKLRWRLFGEDISLQYTYEVMYDTYTAAIDLLLKKFNGEEEKLADLIQKSILLNYTDRKKILAFAARIQPEIIKKDNTVWNQLRKTISHHKSHPNADWALPEQILKDYEDLYELYTPKDALGLYQFLFEDHWPDLFEGKLKDERDEYRYEDYQKKIHSQRISGLSKILSEVGLDGIIRLASEVNESSILGDILAEVIAEGEGLEALFSLLVGQGKQKRFAQAFFNRKYRDSGFDWMEITFKAFQHTSSNVEQQASLLVSFPQSQRLWDFIENLKNDTLATAYWQELNPNFYNLSLEEKIFGIEHFLKTRRYSVLIRELYLYDDQLPSALIVDILQQAASYKDANEYPIPNHEVGHLFETLDKRDDVELKTMVMLEWQYLEILDRYSSGRNPVLLHKELLRDPAFFIEVIKWIYMPNGSEEQQNIDKEMDTQMLANRSRRAYQLISSLKSVPGLSEEGQFDGNFFTSWVQKVREMALDADRLEVADSHIGQLVAYYPEDKDLNWPPQEISELIEQVNTESIKSGFSMTLFNKRGSSSRGPFDGGAIEKGHAKYFEDLAKKNKLKYPNMAAIFTRLAKGYRKDAKMMDDRADRDRLEY